MDQRLLVDRAKQGDHDAFAQLVDASVVRLDAAARLILRDAELARDAVQEGYIEPGSTSPGFATRNGSTPGSIALSFTHASMSHAAAGAARSRSS